jgi:alpha-tubulin suppressor-like RCC1 family protein
MGGNFTGQIGDGTYSQTNTPERVGPSNVLVVSAGYDFSLFVDSASNLWATGDNGRGQLGLGVVSEVNVPANITTGVISIAAGRDHSLFCKADGSLWGMGNNISGALGDGGYASVNVPEQILPNGVTAVAAGMGFSFFIKSDGSLWATGNNSSGQLGDGTFGTKTNRPEQIVSSGVVAVAADFSHSVFLKSDGSLWAMGDNSYGELGDGTTNRSLVPEMIVSNGVTAIAVGQQFSLFVKSDGSLWAMGLNGYGQLGGGPTLGNNTPLYTNAPLKVVSSGVVGVAAGDFHSLFLKSDGSLWAMGNNSSGQLGDGFTGSQPSAFSAVPEQIYPKPPPMLTASVNSTNVQVEATCLFAGTYCLCGTTNVSLPADQWTPLLTNAVYLRGTNNFAPAFTNALSAAPMQFYHIYGN